MNDLTRRRFTVLDEAGKAFPAVEYLACFMDEEAWEAGSAPVRHFIKLIGHDEMLVETDRDVFVAVETGKTFTTLQPTPSPELTEPPAEYSAMYFSR